ncbi:MAG: type II secretion system protein GspK [Rhodospirillaceae bacterium]|nr:type II secretion system protein GspK [Rhodospirillaceae bacterium]
MERDALRGFILPVTLWVIAAIGLAAAILSEWVGNAVTNAIAIQEKINTEIAFADIRNEIIFAVARRPYTNRGLQVGNFFSQPAGSAFQNVLNSNYESDKLIFLDGRPYIVASNQKYAIQIQDGRGLVNLNNISAQNTIRFLKALGVEEGSQSQLADTLQDYRDADDLRRLSGAEENDYRRLGLHPPANGHLMSPWEAQRIIGWESNANLWNTQFERPLMSTCRASGFNPNTAPREVLSSYIDGISMERANMLVNYRENLPFRNARNVGEAAGVVLLNQPFFFSFTPGRCIVVDLIDRESNERIRFSLTLLPLQRDQPWQIDYVLSIPKAYRKALGQLDPEVTFPSPEEIAGATG